MVSYQVHITLFQGIPKFEKMELIIQKNTEVGIKSIVPVIMERTVVKLDEKIASKKLERWQKIAEIAAKQSMRDIIPQIGNITKLKDIDTTEFDAVLVAYENEEHNTGSKRCSSGKADAQRKRFSKVADGRDPSASRFQYPNRLGFLTPQGVTAFRWPRRTYFYQLHAGGRAFCQRCDRYGRSRRPALHRLHHRRVCVTGVILLYGHYRSGRRRAANSLFQH